MNEFSTGFSLLASGSKSDKLALAFQVFDTDKDGFITRVELWQFLRSFLTGLYALKHCGDGAPLSADQHDRILLGTESLASAILREADTRHSSKMSYEEFGHWYNEGGFETVFWLELLDLSKWPYAVADQPEDDDAADGAQSRDDDDDSNDAGDDAGSDGIDDDDDDDDDDDSNDDDDTDDVLFEFPLYVDDASLVISRNDADQLSRLLGTTQLSDMDPEAIARLFDSHAHNGQLSKDNFDAVIRQLVPGDALSDADKTFLSFALSNLFFAFDRDGSDTVDYTEFVAGFSLLASGSKSDKLSLAFRLFDEDGDGYISRSEMWRYLRAFLTVFVALQGDATLAASKSLIGRAAVDLTSLIFRQADTDSNGNVSYAEFGEWYNSGGFEVIPWLELLDLKKWPSSGGGAAAAATDAQSSDRAGSGSGSGSGANASSAPTAAPEDVVFKFPLVPDELASLTLCARDVSQLQAALRTSRLSSVPPERFVDAMASQGNLSRSQFMRVVVELCDDINYRVYDTLTDQYDTFAGGADNVDATQLMVGGLVFMGGSKSDKLSAAFRVLDVDEDEHLTVAELQTFLTCFLTTLCSCSASLRAMPHSALKSTITRCPSGVLCGEGGTEFVVTRVF